MASVIEVVIEDAEELAPNVVNPKQSGKVQEQLREELVDVKYEQYTLNKQLNLKRKLKNLSIQNEFASRDDG